MLTDNPVLLRRHVQLPVLMCVQKKAAKKIVTEADLIDANIASFGDEIGKITNRITSMYEVQSNFEPGSKEYEELQFRINCGQKIQQDAIDKTKGIVANGMPRDWYDGHSVAKIEDEEERKFMYDILADKKPRFMIYIYPDLMRSYKRYVSDTDKKCLREFGINVATLLKIPEEKMTDAQKTFVKYYKRKMPVGLGDCVLNKICKRFEEEFDHITKRLANDVAFDYTILKNPSTYTTSQFNAIRKLYAAYRQRVRDYKIYTSRERVDEDVAYTTLVAMDITFRQECDIAVNNEDVLCNIMIDICYKSNNQKTFVWSMCPDVIIKNLLQKNGGHISYPVKDPEGDIEYGGYRFSIHEREV